MRRWSAGLAVTAAALAGLAAGPGAGSAAAQPSPTPSAEPAELVLGEQVCQITDSRLVELSGLVALDDGYVAVNDSTVFEERLPIFFLDQTCNVTAEQSFLPGRPRDPEDLALDRQADVLWVGDTGDNGAAGTGEGEPRPSVAFWRVDLAGDRTPVIHRFTYPDGQPRDAEALLLDGDGTPIIITKSATGTAELFRPQELRPSSAPEDTVPLEAVGEVTLPLPETEIEHRLGPVARQAVTGAANSPDGSAVVLRSYTDAFEFDVTEGDVTGALTSGQPRITPLPGEPLGEAIAYAPDGERFLTISEVPEDEINYTPAILGYTPTQPPPPEPPPEQAAAGGGGGGLFNDLQDIINLVAAVGVVGLLLVGAGVFGIVRARRAGPGGAGSGEDDPAGGGGGGPAPATGRARPRGSAAVPGSPTGAAGPEQPPNPAGGVYTSSAARAPGAEYGGGDYSGGDYRGADYSGGEYRGGDYGGADYGGAEYGGQPYRGDPEPGRSGYSGAGYDQPGYDHPGHDRARYEQAGYDQPGYDQPGYDHPGYDHPGHDRARYDQAGYGGRSGDAAGDGYPAEHPGYDRADPGHRSGGHPDSGHPAPYDQDWSNGYPPQHAGGGHSGADYYSDDPDYPYEFRERER